MITPEQEERQRREAEIRRRYDRHALVSAHGRLGEEMAAVAEAAPSLDAPTCRALLAAYQDVIAEADRTGRREELERVYRYSSPYPLHPGDLYAIDALARNAFNYAGLVARERAAAHGLADIVPVERAAMGAIIARAMEVARRRGAHAPVDDELAALARRPWDEVMGAGRSGHDGPPAAEPAATEETAR
ncbi:MAG TPA: hypothetical protein VFA11_12740 [Acidimicrobiales bacterium]|nr:hypothetical protein [Acidimicrobiales bacterium]